MAVSSDLDQFLIKIDDDYVACSICLERYMKPKVLPCLHTFCERCLCGWVEKHGELNCPACKTPCDLQDGGISELKDNFFMSSLVDLVIERRHIASGQERVCELCEDKEVSHFCIECCQYLCENCERLHRKIKATKSHKVRLISELDEPESERLSFAQDVVNCQKHPESKVIFYCDTLKATILKLKPKEDCLDTNMEAVKKWLEKINSMFDQEKEKFNHTNINSTRNYAETLLHHANPVQLLSPRPEVTRRTDELLKIGDDWEEPVDGVEFEAASDAVISNLGRIKADACVKKCSIENFPKKVWKVDKTCLIVRTRDARGNDVTPRQNLNGTLNKRNGEVVHLKFSNNYDGTQSTIFRADVKGKNRITLTIDGHAVPGSSFEFSTCTGLVRTIGNQGNGKGKFCSPSGIARDSRGNTAVADTDNSRVQIFNETLVFKDVLSFPNFKNPLKPGDVAISEDSTYFMTDSGNNQVVVSKETGQLIRCFGQGEVKEPRGIAKHPIDDNVYVCSYGSGAVEVYTQDDEHLRTFGIQGSGHVIFRSPHSIAVDSKGTLFVSDFVQLGLVYGCDTLGNITMKSEALEYPGCIAIHSDGYILVHNGSVFSGNHCFYKLNKQGKIVSRIDAKEYIIRCTPVSS
ncbi:tripartite motif-containing protein 2-like [Ptychodera flava]|uniref:tripartite motif-containing protein 2-like n=1 Tax=Ptychodera flava TaxID=63121 RepID=UPI00396A9822